MTTKNRRIHIYHVHKNHQTVHTSSTLGHSQTTTQKKQQRNTHTTYIMPLHRPHKAYTTHKKLYWNTQNHHLGRNLPYTKCKCIMPPRAMCYCVAFVCQSVCAVCVCIFVRLRDRACTCTQARLWCLSLCWSCVAFWGRGVRVCVLRYQCASRSLMFCAVESVLVNVFLPEIGNRCVICPFSLYTIYCVRITICSDLDFTLCAVPLFQEYNNISAFTASLYVYVSLCLSYQIICWLSIISLLRIWPCIYYTYICFEYNVHIIICICLKTRFRFAHSH